MNGDYFVAAVLAALAIAVPLWPTRCHHRWAYIARAWCSTCSWEWEARPGEDLADADAAMQEHRRNPETERTGR